MYDVIIIGAGPAGISASLYTQRANLNTLVLYEDSEESSLEKTDKIENYYGFENGIDGRKLYFEGIEQAKNIGVEIIKEQVTNIQKYQNEFKIKTIQNEFSSKTVILAIGNKKKKIDIKGIEKFEGKGISYCAICDGFFFKNKDVAIIGNGDYAISELSELINLVNSVTILTNGVESSKIKELKNVYINNKKIKEIQGINKVGQVIFEDNTQINIDGIFIAEGVAGITEFAKKIGVKIENNIIVVDENMSTNINGLYACGDCTGGLYQISKAVYEGTKAGMKVIKMIKEES